VVSGGQSNMKVLQQKLDSDAIKPALDFAQMHRCTNAMTGK